MPNKSEVNMPKIFESADFWYALTVILISATAVIGGKYRLKKYIFQEKGKKNDSNNA